MAGVAFDLSRPAFVALDDHAVGIAAEADGGCIRQGFTRNSLLRRLDARYDLVLRQDSATCEASDGKRGTHESQELPAVQLEKAGAMREFIVDVLLELIRPGEL